MYNKLSVLLLFGAQVLVRNDLGLESQMQWHLEQCAALANIVEILAVATISLDQDIRRLSICKFGSGTHF